MSLLQFCWVVFFVLGFYFWIVTNWSIRGHILMKGFASFFMSLLFSIIIYVGAKVFIFIGSL